jgi:hypothetical protein
LEAGEAQGDVLQCLYRAGRLRDPTTISLLFDSSAFSFEVSSFVGDGQVK